MDSITFTGVTKNTLRELDNGRVPHSTDFRTLCSIFKDDTRVVALFQACTGMVGLLDAYKHTTKPHLIAHVREAVRTLVQIAHAANETVVSGGSSRLAATKLVDATIFKPRLSSTQATRCDPTFQRCEFVTRKDKDVCDENDYMCRMKFESSGRFRKTPAAARASIRTRPQDIFLMQRQEREAAESM